MGLFLLEFQDFLNKNILRRKKRNVSTQLLLVCFHISFRNSRLNYLTPPSDIKSLRIVWTYESKPDELVIQQVDYCQTLIAFVAATEDENVQNIIL